MRHLLFMGVGLPILIIAMSMPLYAAVFPGEKARGQFQNAGPRHNEHATRKGASGSAAFRDGGTAGTACKEDEARAQLSLMEIRAASVASRADTIARRRREAEQQMKSGAEAIQPLSFLFERLSLYPVETLLAVPASPDAYLHGLLILQGSARRMQAEADALQRDQAELDANLAAARAARERAGDLLKDIAAARAACAAAKAKANAAASAAASTAAQRNPKIAPAALGARRAELKPRKKSQDATKPGPVGQAEAAAGREAGLARPAGLCAMTMGKLSRARWRPPVHGVIVKGWGEATDAGPATGVSYQALSGARVIAPCGGRVVFANSFRSYGQLLIVDCGGGYHLVLSGFEKLDVQPGQTISAGQPIGVMPFSDPKPTARRQVLYIELRHNGQPVNPAPWLRSSS